MQHRKVLVLFLLISFVVLPLIFAACGGGEQAPAPEPTPTSTPAPVPTSTPIPTLPPALPETLFLEILEPTDESIVNEMPLVVVGKTVPDAVVSVDGQTAEVNAQGQFAVLVSLDSGPNLIEVVASDLTGAQESALLAVIYIP
ncbi:MAG: hypothetical protein ACE5JL_00330 [Dehalococcoidia bacterium]